MSYRARMLSYAALAFGSAAILGVIIGKVVPTNGGVENPAIVLPLLLLVACGVMLAGWPWWNKTDDLQKQGQLLSWWWGGNFGAILMLISVVVLTGRHSDFSLGAGMLFLAEFAGMAVAFLIWKFRGRAAVE